MDRTETKHEEHLRTWVRNFVEDATDGKPTPEHYEKFAAYAAREFGDGELIARLAREFACRLHEAAHLTKHG